MGDYQYDQYNGAIDYDYNNHDYQDQDSTKTNEVEVVEVRKFSLSIFIYIYFTSVCHNFLKGQEVTLPCYSHANTFLIFYKLT